MKITVTGAMGFIGGHLVPALIDREHGVTGIVEPGWSADAVSWHPFPADITSGDNLRYAFSGADVVIHLAARNHVLKETASDSLAEYRRVNVEGTRNVVRAATAAGVEYLVHVSSVKVVGEESDAVLDEGSTCTPKTPYGVSKLESERVVAEEAARGNMKAVILRLPMVYGPGNRGNLPRMIRWADRGLPFPLLQPENLRSMVYVGNVVAGILALLKGRPSGVSTYFLKDRDDCTTRFLYSTICRELGKTPRFLSVPSMLVRLGGIVSDDLRKIAGSLRVSSARIEKEIGFHPPHSLPEGLGKTVRWHMCSTH